MKQNKNDLNNIPFNESDELLLWNFIDGTLTQNQKTEIELLVNSNAQWRTKYNELLQLNNLFHDIDTEQPSMRFTKNVMDEISKYHVAPATSSYVNKKIFLVISMFFVCLIIAIIFFMLKNINWHDTTTLSEIKLPASIDKIPNILLSNFLAYFLVIINVVFGFYLFDRYLIMKRKQHHSTGK